MEFEVELAATRKSWARAQWGSNEWQEEQWEEQGESGREPIQTWRGAQWWEERMGNHLEEVAEARMNYPRSLLAWEERMILLGGQGIIEQVQQWAMSPLWTIGCRAELMSKAIGRVNGPVVQKLCSTLEWDHRKAMGASPGEASGADAASGAGAEAHVAEGASPGAATEWEPHSRTARAEKSSAR